MVATIRETKAELLPDGLLARSAEPSDHPRIIGVMKEWWGGRDLTSMLPRLFLEHFCETSFIVEKNDELIGFLIGFLSPLKTNEGYIHFCGVHPDYRKFGIGRYLYHRFFALCRESSRDILRSCTSPVNKTSILFHTRMGFRICSGNGEVDGVSVSLDYNRPGDPKVLFEYRL